MSPKKKCKTCGYFEPVETMAGRGWCRHPKVDPSGIGYRKLERADGLGCRAHRPLWWISRAEWKRQQHREDMLFLLDE